MQADRDFVPRITLRDGSTIPQLGFGTLAVQPDRASSDASPASSPTTAAIEAHSPLGHNREPLSDGTITDIAATHRKSTAQVILRWHVQHGRIAIPKSTRPERMRENIAIFDFELAPEEMASIDALDRGANGRVGPNPDIHT